MSLISTFLRKKPTEESDDTYQEDLRDSEEELIEQDELRDLPLIRLLKFFGIDVESHFIQVLARLIDRCYRSFIVQKIMKPVISSILWYVKRWISNMLGLEKVQRRDSLFDRIRKALGLDSLTISRAQNSSLSSEVSQQDVGEELSSVSEDKHTRKDKNSGFLEDIERVKALSEKEKLKSDQQQLSATHESAKQQQTQRADIMHQESRREMLLRFGDRMIADLSMQATNMVGRALQLAFQVTTQAVKTVYAAATSPQMMVGISQVESRMTFTSASASKAADQPRLPHQQDVKEVKEQPFRPAFDSQESKGEVAEKGKPENDDTLSKKIADEKMLKFEKNITSEKEVGALIPSATPPVSNQGTSGGLSF